MGTIDLTHYGLDYRIVGYALLGMYVKEISFWDKKHKTFLPPEKVTLNGKGQITMIEGDASIETDDIAVCQFIGLIINGVKVFENDIVRVCRYALDIDVDAKHYQVVWSDEPSYPAFDLYPDDVG